MPRLMRLAHLLVVVSLLLAACAPASAVPTAIVMPTGTQPAITTVAAAPSTQPTATAAPSAAPHLVYALPSRRTVATRWPATQLVFDRAMDPASVVIALTVTPTVALALHWEGTTLTVTPGEPLDPDTSYAFTLGQSAVDVQGQPLMKTYRWSYRLSPLVADTGLPTARQSDQGVSLDFNYALEAASLRAAFRLNPAVSGALAVSADGRGVTFTPAVSLTMNTTYTVAFEGALLDAAGQPVPLPQPITFRTPTPILTYGPQGARGVAPTTPIRMTFDRLMDPASTAAALTIAPAVSGQVTWNETTLIFTPSDYFAENTRYVVTMGSSALDADGRALMTAPFTWSFLTGKQQPVASFGQGPNAQVLAAAGRRAVQFVYFQAAPAALTFELYALTTEQFVERYGSSYTSDVYTEANAISTEGAPLVRSWQVSDPPVHANDYGGLIGEAAVPADVPPGLYVLDLRSGLLNDQLLLVLSGHVLALKESDGQLLAWVTDPHGQPAAGAQVTVYNGEGQPITQGQADADGVFQAAVARTAEASLVIATTGDDHTIAGLGSEWQSGYDRWYGWQQPAPVAKQFAAYLYTDRPIYRPGQTVFFKAILRHEADAVLSVLAPGTPVTLRVRDARNNLVQTLALTTEGFGSVDGEFVLAEGAMLGSYALEAEVGGETHRQTFKVEDYRKPDYEVTVQADAAQYVTGDTVRLTIDTRYFFGEPVANADLVVRQYELGSYYDCWEYCTSDGERWYDTGEPVRHVQTDAAGRYSFNLTAKPGQLYRSGWNGARATRWGIEVTADDGSHQTVSGIVTLEVFEAAEQLTLETGSWVQAPGQPFAVTAQARTIADVPVAGRAMTLQLRRWVSSTYDYTEVIQTLDLVSGADGQARGTVTVVPPGYYQAHLTGLDARGNPLQANTWLYIFADGAAWAGRYNSGLQVTAEADHYAPGDSATLLVESAFSGPALLTVGRGSVRRQQVVALQAPLTRLAVPIEAGDAPNIFVTIQAWQPQDTALASQAENAYLMTSLPDAHLRTATAALAVAVLDKRLTVTLTPNQATYLPGAAATFTVRVTNERHEPVSAELSLALVDEAIFSLSEELAGPIFDAFYFQRALLVRTFDSLTPVRWLLDEGGRGGGGGGDLAVGDLRTDFPDTAVWVPVLHTDWNGEAVVTITLPDSLTTWRLTAKAVTADTQVGEAVTTILTQQPISLRPLLPRSLTAGDEVLLSAMVRNDGDTAREVQVTLAVTHLRLSTPATQTVHLEPGQQRLVGWPATATEAGEAGVTLRAVPAEAPDGGGGDAIYLPLPIQPLAIPAVTTQVGDFASEYLTTIDVPAQALTLSTVRLELSRSIAGTLLTGLEYLTGFPYGCVEQTMSRALPNAVVGRALNQLGVNDPALQASLPPMINASVQRLFGFQHDDGGWGWWHDDVSNDYQTAWVVFGLATTAQAGYEIDPAVIERGVDWLADNLNAMDVRTRAFALYSMAVAGQGDLKASLTLARQADRLDTFSQAGLALALHHLGAATEARQLLDGLAATAVTQDGQVFWPSAVDDGHYYDKTMASTTRSTALALAAFVAIRPDHALEPGIVRYLMSQRRASGWGTTNETSFTLLALTDHLLARESATTETAYQVELNGQVVASGTLGRGAPAVSVDLPVSDLAVGANALRLVQTGGGRLYYVVSSRMYVAQAAIAAAGAVSVTRQYVDPETRRPITGTVTAGQLVQVQLTVKFPNAAYYVLVEDHLPGGLEALNEGLNVTSHEATAYAWEEPVFYWQDYGYNNKEVYGDRVSFFITEVYAGQHVYTYYARAVRSGTFVALPAEASAMYDLTVWGRSSSAVMIIGE